MLSSAWVMEAMMPAIRETSSVRRYPSGDELGTVLGGILGTVEVHDRLVEEAGRERLREAG